MKRLIIVLLVTFLTTHAHLLRNSRRRQLNNLNACARMIVQTCSSENYARKICIESGEGVRIKTTACEYQKLQCETSGVQWTIVNVADNECVPIFFQKPKAKTCVDVFNESGQVCMENKRKEVRLVHPCDVETYAQWVAVDRTFCNGLGIDVRSDRCWNNCNHITLKPVCLQNHMHLWRTVENECVAREVICREVESKWRLVGNFTCPTEKLEDDPQW